MIADIIFELDERSKTPALVLSADRLEVANPNWTFESVRATMCVGRGMSTGPPFPAGWYYEVTLKSAGILQIGKEPVVHNPLGLFVLKKLQRKRGSR